MQSALACVFAHEPEPEGETRVARMGEVRVEVGETALHARAWQQVEVMGERGDHDRSRFAFVFAHEPEPEGDGAGRGTGSGTLREGETRVARMGEVRVEVGETALHTSAQREGEVMGE
jgi:hypothetical protein